MAFAKESLNKIFHPFVYHAEKHGLTSKTISVIYNGCKCWKEQWFYKDQPTDYKRSESFCDWAQRNNIELKG